MSLGFDQLQKSKDMRAMIKEIVKRLNKLEKQANVVETIDFKPYLRSNNDRLIWTGNATIALNAGVDNPDTDEYRMPLEPDGKLVTVWYKFDGINSDGTMTDRSGQGLHADVDGQPTSQTAPKEQLSAMQFDGQDDRIHGPNAQSINITGMTTGFSITFFFNPIAVSLSGGRSRVLASKTDDNVNTRDNGWIVWIEPAGTLYFRVRIAGVNYTAQYPSAFTSLNRWYRIVLTFTNSNKTPRMYIQGAISSATEITNYAGDVVLPELSTDIYIGGSGHLDGSGMASGMFSDFRYYREKIISSTEIANLQRNGYTISNIELVGIAGAGNFGATDAYGPGAPPPPPGTPPPPPGSPPPPPTIPPSPPPSTRKSFSATSFTSASFT